MNKEATQGDEFAALREAVILTACLYVSGKASKADLEKRVATYREAAGNNEPAGIQ